MKINKLAMLLLGVLLATLSCQAPTKDTSKSNIVAAAIENDSTTIMTLSNDVIAALQNQDYKKVATYVHSSGLRFSPYNFIDTSTAVMMSATDVAAITQNTKPIHWGTYDGSGEPIDLNFKDYAAKFIYNADFLKAEKVSYNTSKAQGNSPDNSTKIYPNSLYSEYYFSGFDKKYDGMDWTALRLIFQKEGAEYRLVAIVHNQWTS